MPIQTFGSGAQAFAEFYALRALQQPRPCVAESWVRPWNQKPKLYPRSAGINRRPRACSSVDRASASGLGALASQPRFPDALDWDPDIYGIRAVESCRARRVTEDVRPG